MTHPEDMPFETYHPNLDEVLERLQNGTLGEVSEPGGADSQQLIFLRQDHPKANADVYVAPAGHITYPFERKFGQGFDGWKVGDIVHGSRLRVERGDDGVFCLRTITGRGYFDDIYELSKADQATIATAGLARLDLDVEITGSGERVISMIDRYPASIRGVNAIEQPWDGRSRIESGKAALVQGTVLDYTAGGYDAELQRSITGQTSLRLPSGEIVQVAVPYNIYVGDGVLDVTHPTSPLPGDILQMHVAANNTGSDVILADNSGYIVRPSEARQTAHAEARADVAARITELASLSGASFRHAYADLLRAHTEVTSFGRTLQGRYLLSHAERAQLAQMRTQKFPDTPEALPNPDDLMLSRYNLDSLLTVGAIYDIDTLTLSRREYYDFCLQLATGQIDRPTRTDVQAHPFSLLRDDFTISEQLNLCRQTCETWLPHMATFETVTDTSTPSPEQQITPHTKNVMYWALATLGDLCKENADAQQYARQIKDFLPKRLQDALELYTTL